MPVTASPLARSVRAVVEGAPHDTELLARIVAGDPDALAAVYDQHADLVFGLARRVTRDENLARDLTQEVFAYLWEFPARVDLSRGALRSYLAVVTHRRAVDAVRSSVRRARIEAGQPLAPVAGPEDDVVETMTGAWRRRRLAAGLAGLPAEQRRAVELAYYDGLTYKQVAQALSIPEGTAKSRLRLAMNHLRAALGTELRATLS